MIYVCNLIEMPIHAATLAPSHLISLVPREEQPETPQGLASNRHLRIEIHDISQPFEGFILPEEQHISELIAFIRDWPAQQPLLIHCVAGVSRSMAAALIAAVIKGDGDELRTARRLRAAAPHAHPNQRIISVADTLLGCQGRLIAACEAMGLGNAVIAGPLVRMPIAG